ncbi:L-histidine N(alpha)-methyltransferase [uncultured Formosa sp.]|uniref:L-histidine N(alpha)-methyltransferase n=1 Tax=uncultured Formosa sp. TaxID=255435 RepID=UPI0026060653|nr:L-histidine N(alpha)-methyltransferase [uncultured Formosa sp.]
MKTTIIPEIVQGLKVEQKYISSKFFYDDAGSRIFQEIMQMQDYYLTDSEFEILSLQAEKIHCALQFSEPFNIIELGAGDGFKTFKLLEYFVSKNIHFNYVPIDISQEAISMLCKKLKERLPGLHIQPQVGDYFEILKGMSTETIPNLLLFLGSNIGNYLRADAADLLRLFNDNMNVGDKLLIGFDLKKNPLTIQKAYFDSHGVTKRFNLNLLLRMNREFDADFKLDDFDFYCHYNPSNGQVKSYLVSLKVQTVYFKSINERITFQQNELIWTELSKKYSVSGIETLAKLTGFKTNQHFLDCKHYFTDSLWEK